MTNKKIPLSFRRYIYFAIVAIYMLLKHAKASSVEVAGQPDKPHQNYEVFRFHFEGVSDAYAITLWILLGSLAKIAFHLFSKITNKLPESCLLIILGLVVGGLFFTTKLAQQESYVLSSEVFFIYLLPPIILEAGYFMPNRPFFNNIGTILLFAIFNTILNVMLTGITLYLFSLTPIYGGTEFEVLQLFVFASLISAVDPVSVLATFVEIQVNDMLYIIVFGESLLNDAVSVVLYKLFESFAEMGVENITGLDIALGSSSFLVVALGGSAIGIVFGAIASFTTKYTEHTPILEPLIIIAYSYLAYLTAEMTSTSSILAITFCGMFMKQYVEFNISKKSYSTTEYVLKMSASIMETIIFMFMGLSVVSNNHQWNTGFVAVTLISCTIYRIVGCFLFGWIANRWRMVQLTITDLIIMSYGGIRGAMAFALVLILDEEKYPRKKEFVTATIVVVFFTVFIQGMTIGPLIKFLNVKRKDPEEPTMNAKLSNRLIDHTMTCLEAIAGVSGGNFLRNKVRVFNKRYLNTILLRGKHISKDQKLLNTFQKINELNMNKAAENIGFVLRKATMYPTKEAVGLEWNEKKRSAGELEMLENVMFTSPRRQSFAVKENNELADVDNTKSRSKSTVSFRGYNRTREPRKEPTSLEVNERESYNSQLSVSSSVDTSHIFKNSRFITKF